MLQGLQTIPGLPKVRAVGNRAVISHQKRVVMLDQRPHCISQFFRRRRPIFSQRHTTKRQDDFGKNWLIDRQSSDGERWSMWRMSMTNSFDVRPLAID